MRLSGVAALAASVCLCCIGQPPAHAAGFSVNPIHLELNPAQSATSLTVANYNPQALFMQVRVYRWEHKEREDVLTEAGGEAPLVTPPLFRLGPNGGSQVIRVGFQRPAAPPSEESQWRVIVEEVPKAQGVTAPAPATAAAPDAVEPAAEPGAPPLSISVHVRVSLPLFQRPPNVHKDLQWTLERAASGAVKLTAQNLGSITERLDELHLGPTDDPGVGVTGPVYVFPGERRSFELHPTIVLPAGNVRLRVQGTPRPLISELVLSAQ